MKPFETAMVAIAAPGMRASYYVAQMGSLLGLLIRAVNFCVLSVVGFVLLSPVWARDRPLDRQLGLLLRQSQNETTQSDYRQAYDSRLAQVFGNLRAQIHGDLCRRSDFEILHPASCGRDGSS